jgi:hypothetical protein
MRSSAGFIARSRSRVAIAVTISPRLRVIGALSLPPRPPPLLADTAVRG